MVLKRENCAKHWRNTIFQKLKTKNQRKSIFKNLRDPASFSRSPGADSSVTKGNEAERLVRCRHCGWICDTERDVNLKDGSYAGFGISQGAKLTAGTSVGDKVVPAAGAVSSSADTYHSRTVSAGCPCCGSYVYHPRQRITPFPVE